jgi:hypothetical protein
VPLAGCAYGYDGYDYYGAGYGVAWNSYPYDVWYDGHYGSFYDGYWGTDGYFWYRPYANSGNYYRGGNDHFYHSQPGHGGGYHEYRGSSHQPPGGARMPNYPGGGHGGASHGSTGRGGSHGGGSRH